MSGTPDTRSRSTIDRVGFVGLGNIGLPMATRLVRCGFEVHGWDVRESAMEGFRSQGGQVGRSAGDVATGSSHVAVAVYEPDAEIAVAQELLPAMRPGAILMVHSTVTPSVIHRLAQQGGRLGVRVIDAPVSGGDEAAESGELVIMVGGEDESVAACGPLLDGLAAHIVRTGPLGSGAAAKLCNNLMLFVNNAGICEAIDLAIAYELPEELIITIGRLATGRSWALDHWDRQGDLLLESRASGTDASFEGLVKDLSLACNAGAERGQGTPLASLAAEELRRWYATRYGQADAVKWRSSS